MFRRSNFSGRSRYTRANACELQLSKRKRLGSILPQLVRLMYGRNPMTMVIYLTDPTSAMKKEGDSAHIPDIHVPDVYIHDVPTSLLSQNSATHFILDRILIGKLLQQFINKPKF